MTDIQPASDVIVRRGLHLELQERLREMIIEGELKPGEKILERVLSERFGVSRTPLRESLRALAVEGLVSLLPNKGAIVSVITQGEINELYPIIGSLEALAGEYVCAQATESDLEHFRSLHAQLRAHYEARQESAYRRTNREFHDYLFEVSGNVALREMYQSLLVRIHSSRFIVQKTQDDWTSAMEDHESIIAALEARDAPKLAVILKHHLAETAARSTQNALTRDGSS